MEIRVAEAHDLDEVMDLYDRACDAMAGTPHDAHWRRGLHPRRKDVEAARKAGCLLVGEQDGSVVGAAILDHDLDGADEVFGAAAWGVGAKEDERAVLHLLVVDPPMRGRGLGTQLLKDCIDRARAQGCRTLWLDVIATNLSAIALYEHAGFARVGSGTRDVGDEGEAIGFVAMRLTL